MNSQKAHFFFALFLFFTCFLLSPDTKAVQIFGKVTSTEGKNLPFITIYQEGTSYGTITNQEGNYFLHLNEGTYQIVFRSISYQTQIKEVIVTKENVQKDEKIELNIQMKHLTMLLETIVIDSNKDNKKEINKAHSIIQSAQQKREFYRNQAQAFSCDIYIKNVQQLDTFHIPKLFSTKQVKQLKQEWQTDKVIYFSELVSKYYFLAPNYQKEIIISSRANGDSRGFAWNSSFFLIFDLYQNSLSLPIGDRKFISPIAKNAFNYYDYVYEAEFTENITTDKKVKVHKIKVVPKHTGQPLFFGDIYIQDSTWRIHSVDLKISRQAGIEIIDTLAIKQLFSPITDKLWMCSSQSFLFNYKINLFSVEAIGKGNYTGSFFNYHLNPNFTSAQLEKDIDELDKDSFYKNRITEKQGTKQNQKQNEQQISIIDTVSLDKLEEKIKNKELSTKQVKAEEDFFSNELSILLDSSTQKTTSYWQKVRPVPLTTKEANHYHRSDSIEEAHSQPSYLDSMDRQSNKFKFKDLLVGYSYKIRKKELTYKFPSVLNVIQSNTVEGLALNFGVDRIKNREKDLSQTKLGADARYGFGSKQFLAKGEISHLFNRINDRYIFIEGGAFVEQFEPNAIPYFVNGVYTQLREQNLMKIYQKNYFQLGAGQRIFQGAFFRLQGSFERRIPLENNPKASSLVDRKDIAFTSNLPIDYKGESVFFELHNAVLIKARFEYLIGEKYILRPKQRISLSSKYPLLALTYTQAIKNIAQSKADFGKLVLNISDGMNLGILGTINYDIQTGAFLWNNYTSFVDNFHFSTSPIFVAKNNLRQFLLLPFYEYSTTKPFVEVHAEQHFNGYLLHRIGFMKKLGWQLVASSNYLYTPAAKHYTELSIGFENIFKVIRTDFVFALNSSLKQDRTLESRPNSIKKIGIRFSIGI
ncbi:DUF5686 and carboxypeptidase regulatory-like domain-containing protein [Bernardetia sp. Wsw4-3y2]|uniref:DUF5686 and carboxypeptidase regulatory-like domain-containing protein n=1 Tax=Bernardetia sp. Wsw4-3y2 TaxID=3127471 RepID=UPI0030CBDB21